MNISLNNITDDPVRTANTQQREVSDVKKSEAGNSFAGYTLDIGNNSSTIMGDKKKTAEELIEAGSPADAKNRQDMMILMSNTLSPEAYKEMHTDTEEPVCQAKCSRI